jgi:hypothetical protein
MPAIDNNLVETASVGTHDTQPRRIPVKGFKLFEAPTPGADGLIVNARRARKRRRGPDEEAPSFRTIAASATVAPIRLGTRFRTAAADASEDFFAQRQTSYRRPPCGGFCTRLSHTPTLSSPPRAYGSRCFTGSGHAPCCRASCVGTTANKRAGGGGNAAPFSMLRTRSCGGAALLAVREPSVVSL